MAVKCWECGKDVDYDTRAAWQDYLLTYENARHKAKQYPDAPWKRIYCDSCVSAVRATRAENKRIYIEYKTKITIERMMELLERQAIDIYKYQAAISAVIDFATEHPEKFESSDEMIAAAMMINRRIPIKLQHRVERYSIDMLVTAWKCAVEIDGERHKDKLLYDSNRDISLRSILGADWEIVRIPTDLIEKNATMFPEAVLRLKAEKQKIRAENCGIIPASFSRRDKAKALEIERIARTK